MRISDRGIPNMRRALVWLLFFLVIRQAPGVCQGADCCGEPAKADFADSREAFAVFSRASDCYLKDNKFDEACACFTDAGLKGKTAAANADYFCALTRYRQLKYLEDKQLWDEYFDRGNEYRDQITQALAKVIKTKAALEPVTVYAHLLLWRFHKDQEDAFTEETLESLMAVVNEYGKKATDPAPIKDAADTFTSYGEKAKAKQLYSLYINAVLAASIELKQLKTMGDGFLKEQNLDLAESVYDAYFQKLAQDPAQKDTLTAELAALAQAFAFKDEGLKDPLYAEKIFQKLEETGGKQVFTEDLLYQRAYNLEKFKEFTAARDVYVYLLQNFPQAKHADRIILKVGLLSAYAAKDLAGAREYFAKLADKEPASAEVVASLYHLGLLSQWEDDLDKAGSYYKKITEKAGSAFAQTVALAQARLKEIEQKQLLDNRLRLFLDAALHQENAASAMTKSELSASVYRPQKGQEVEIRAVAYPPQSGCLQVSLEYLWLGDLGFAAPGTDVSSFTTTFSEPGVKMVGVVVTMASGMLDRNFDLLDVE